MNGFGLWKTSCHGYTVLFLIDVNVFVDECGRSDHYQQLTALAVEPPGGGGMSKETKEVTKP